MHAGAVPSQKEFCGHAVHDAVVGPVVDPKVPGVHTQSTYDPAPVAPIVVVPAGQGSAVEFGQK